MQTQHLGAEMDRWLVTVIVVVVTMGPLPAWGQGWDTRTVGGMSAQIYVPSTMPEGGRGLLIGLHGCGQANTVLRDQGNFEGAAEEFGVVIALPAVPNGGVYMGCWDYYGASHTRTNRHTGPVLALVSALLEDEGMEIDAGRVGVTGLSSGAGMALVLGCVAPDVFSGVAPVAGPAVGTEAMQIGSVAVTSDQARRTCTSLAGSSADWFAHQKAALVTGTQDFVVAMGYAPLNADMFVGLYEAQGASMTSESLDVPSLEGHESRGEGTIWSDTSNPRVALISIEGMGHAWPAGSGAGGEMSFVASSGPNFAHFLGWFFSGIEGEPPDSTSPTDGGDPTSPTDGGEPTSPTHPSDAGVDGSSPSLPEGATIESPLLVDGCLTIVGQIGSLQTLDAATATLTGGEQQVMELDHSGLFELVECAPPTGCLRLVVEIAFDDGRRSSYCTEPFEIVDGGGGEGIVAEVMATLVEHASRLELFDEGYGAADATYTELLAEHGVMEEFTLYQGGDGHWYASADNVPGVSALELSLSCDVSDDQLPECPGDVVGVTELSVVDEGCSCRAAALQGSGRSTLFLFAMLLVVGLRSKISP